MPDEPKPEGPPSTPESGPAKSADAEKPAAAKPAAPAAAKPAAPAAHAAPKPPAPMATTPWESDLTKNLKDHFGDQITEFSSYLGQNFLVAKPDAVISILEFLKLEEDFDYLVDLTAADYPKRAERFEVVYILYSFPKNERIRVKTSVAEGARPGTATGVHLTANWLEREVFDMFGIEFEGHPDMRRILLPEEWEGYPLRKDYGILQQDQRWVQENLGIESGQ
jgi:NADH-quinone oxidoreductase subunit C